MTGEQIKRWLCEELRKAQTEPAVLKDIHITNSTGDAENLWDLIGDSRYELFCDNNEWNGRPGVMTDVIGGMTPDIVIRSNASAQNRIIIEAKGTDKLS
jgi:hypothetical protein